MRVSALLSLFAPALTVGVFVVGVGAAAPAAADDVTLKSEAVAGSAIPFSIVEGVIDAPPDAVWAVVSRCGDYIKNMPRIAASQELSRTGDELSFTTTCKVTADLPFPFSDLVSVSKAVHTVTPGEKYLRKWTFVSGDYEINEGSWTLVGLEGGKKTRATYRIRAKPNLPLPDGMIASFSKDTLPEVIRRVRAAAVASTASAKK